MNRAATFVFLAVLLPLPAAAETITGIAQIVDGDTLEIKDTKVRLWGIDAPESAQRCKDESGALYPCGLDTSHALSKQIGRKPVSCTRRDTDRYGRMVGLGTVEGVDVSKWMVQHGQAIAFRKYSLDYVADEDRAKNAKVGLWAGEFQDPSDFRHQPRTHPAAAHSEHRTCLCPDDRDRAGHRCGKRSAAYRAGRTNSICAGR